MRHDRITHIREVIAYIETHLTEKLDLERVAEAAHYSRYHLHRMFTDAAGMTIHDYIRRRQLTEAAKLLVCSEKPILEIALTAGYESQQAFTDIFHAMYKQTPLEYREKQTFYPLQLPFTLQQASPAAEMMGPRVTIASEEDIPNWMDLVTMVIDGFPGFEEAEHLERLRGCVERREALIVRDQRIVAGAAAYSRETGSIDFLAVHPQYRKHGIAKALLDAILCSLSADQEISITTFREGDRADTGQRRLYQQLGFAESGLLTEYGYPTQRLVLHDRAGSGSGCADRADSGEAADE